MTIGICHSLVAIAMKFVYVILIFISLVSAELEILNSIDVENSDININKHVDQSIPQIAQFIVNRGLDPLNLPQTKTKLWTKPPNNTEISNLAGPMIYTADLILHSGILKHLSNLKRYNDATLSYKDKVLKLNVGFEFKLLQGTYNFTVKLVFLNLKGRLIASAKSVRAKIGITFNTKNYTLALDKFELEVPGSIKVVLEGKNGVDWLNTVILNIVAPFFKKTITNVIQKEAANAIRMCVDEINNIIAKRKLVFENHSLKYTDENQILIPFNTIYYM